MAAVKLFVVDRVFKIQVETLIASSLGIIVEFTDRWSSRPNVELLVSTVWLGLLDDEDAADELDLVELVALPAIELLLDVVELVEFKTLLDTTPKPTTITMTTRMAATILEEIARLIFAIA